MSIDESTRRQLIVLARRPSARVKEFSPDRPTDWQPKQVRNPEGMLDSHYTDAAAWDLIASRLEAGHDVETVELRKPEGKRGYVMKIALEMEQPLLYVKLQLGSGKIIGRSFHYSESDQKGPQK